LGILALLAFIFPDYTILGLEHRIIIIIIGVVGIISIELNLDRLKQYIISKLSSTQTKNDSQDIKKSNDSPIEKTRKDFPLYDFLQNAHQEIIFVVVTNEFVLRFKTDELKKVIFNGVKITTIILNPNSDDVKHKEYLFKSNDLKENIEKQLKNLCKLKLELGNMGDKLVIKTYDSRIDYSYIVIDPYSENSRMNIEELNQIDPDKRKNEIAFKNGNNSSMYMQHWETIISLKTNEYSCL
jgi:hypothetical protein